MLKKICTALVTISAVISTQVIASDTFPIINGTGNQIGEAIIESGPRGSVIRVEIQKGGLTPGWHGIHLHQVADCSDIGEFKHSKGHVNPEETMHGFLNPEGAHPADLPNIFAHSDGSSVVEILAADVSFGGVGIDLADKDGSAIVIHENPDDHNTQPIGGAGARVACSELK